MAADRDVSRNLTRLGQILGQASVALKEKPIPINQGDQCDGHLEDAGEPKADKGLSGGGLALKNMILEKLSQSAVIQSPFRPSSAVCDHLLELAMLRQALP